MRYRFIIKEKLFYIMSRSPQKYQGIKSNSPKKWSDVSCQSCNKLLPFNHFTCQNCKSNFCLECFKGVISIINTSSCCNLNSTQIIKIQESIEEYQSALSTCKFSDNGCENILPFKEMCIHTLKCPFKFQKCKNENLIEESKSQILNNCVYEKASLPENQLTIFMNQIEEHSKCNSSCLYCKVIISNKLNKEHIQFCKMNLESKRFKLSQFENNKNFFNEYNKNILDPDLQNAKKNIIIRKMNNDLNPNNENNINALARQIKSFNFSKLKK